MNALSQSLFTRSSQLFNLYQVRFATKKAGGSSKNGRDSAGRRLGIKVWPLQFCTAGSIIVRQRGSKFKPGVNVGMGKDHTIFAKLSGRVQFQALKYNRKRHVVSIVQDQVAAVA